jgi:hypothetical protein
LDLERVEVRQCLYTHHQLAGWNDRVCEWMAIDDRGQFLGVSRAGTDHTEHGGVPAIWLGAGSSDVAKQLRGELAPIPVVVHLDYGWFVEQQR